MNRIICISSVLVIIGCIIENDGHIIGNTGGGSRNSLTESHGGRGRSSSADVASAVAGGGSSGRSSNLLSGSLGSALVASRIEIECECLPAILCTPQFGAFQSTRIPCFEETMMFANLQTVRCCKATL
ncbi:hypothetical protein CHS0354_031144 [Potamilus streckersoni]|uniref:Uncharacterized protein n=1 Tax=Potamilus streckersoni TaxID=2493646 RepID=A0AAE0TCR8_9BIVA|nr:hypothetical protein CHS0354_031144 [Potamilus streckersoni]